MDGPLIVCRESDRNHGSHNFLATVISNELPITYFYLYYSATVIIYLSPALDN